MPGGNLEAHVAQHRAPVVVAETDVLEADGATADLQLARAGPVGHFAVLFEQAEHALHVRQRVADFAVHEAEEMQRHVQLDEKGVDQHQIADGHGPLHHALAGHEHENRDADGDDRALAGVQHRQRGLVAHRRLFPGLQRFVVTPRLEAFVAEVFHRFVIEQAVYGAGVGLGIHVVHVAPENHAPFGDQQRERDIGDERHDGHHEKPRVVLDQQDDRHEADLQQRRQDVEQHEIEQEADAGGAALDVARHAAGLAFEVEAQGKIVQVLEHLERHAPDRALRDLGEHRVAQFTEQGVAETQQAVCDQEEYRQRQHGLRRIEGIHDLLQHQRHGDVRHLGQGQKQQRQHHPPAELPQVGQQRFDGFPVVLAGGRVAEMSRSHVENGVGRKRNEF